MEEVSVNLHNHTVYSDGAGTHNEIAQAAIKAGLDIVIVTDHNVLVKDASRYYQNGYRKVLLIAGEEIHNRSLHPQKNHLIIFGVDRELAHIGQDTQYLINQVNHYHGVSFIAHPYDESLPSFNETDITWERWDTGGFTGIEIWNGLSEMKTRAKSKLKAALYAFFPFLLAKGPNSQAVMQWDALTASGKKLVAVGGSDAHQLNIHFGPFTRLVFPYETHFKAINTHLIIPEALSGDVGKDIETVISAFRQGHAYIGYDLPASTRGFRFTAQGLDQQVIMGDDINLNNGGVTFQIRLPFANQCRLIKDGALFKTLEGRDAYTQIVTQPGAYRVESYLKYFGDERGWIFSNPIYVKDSITRTLQDDDQ